MDKQSIFFTCIVAIISILIMFKSIKLLAKKSNIKMEQDDEISLAYSIWLSSLLISFMLFLKVALQFIENSIEIIIYSKTIDNTFWAVIQKIALFTGFTFLATFLFYFIINSIIKFFFGARKDFIEIEKNNIAYFLIKGLLYVFLIISILPLFEHFLSWFLPVVNSPFYH